MKKKKNNNKMLLTVICVAVLGFMAISFSQMGETKPFAKPKVCLDAGHGGSDVGAEYNGRYEKDDNLRLTLAVGEILEENGINVIYTREEDVFVELEDRAAFANKKHATHFISIHRNSAESAVSGVEIWIESTGPDYDKSFAKYIADAIDDVGYGDKRGVKQGYQGNRFANYLVNSATEMPSCLIEMGFITTPLDNELFDKNFDAYAQAIADGIIEGIEKAEE